MTPARSSTSSTLTVSDGQDVDIRASGVWVLDGAASEVTINVDAPEDAEVYLFLNGLSIVNRGRPCVYVGRVGKIYLIPVDDCSFTVSGKFRKDPDRKANAAIYSCTDLTLCGEAKLTVDSSKNGIVCRDKLRILEGDYAPLIEKSGSLWHRLKKRKALRRSISNRN